MGTLGAILKHPDDFYPLLKLKMAARQIERQIPPEPHWAFCYTMLRKVSRSFTLVIQQLGVELRNAMDIESVKCECCGLKEDCTQDYIEQVKAKFDGKWLCGLCSEAVTDEVCRGKRASSFGMEEAVRAHMSFCGKFNSNPAFRVADGMRQMLRRRSDVSSSPSSSSKKFSRCATTRLC